MANIFELPSKDGNITPEKVRNSRQMQLCDKTAYVLGLRYRWDHLLSMNPARRLAHFMPPWSPSNQFFSGITATKPAVPPVPIHLISHGLVPHSSMIHPGLFSSEEKNKSHSVLLLGGLWNIHQPESLPSFMLCNRGIEDLSSSSVW